MKKQYLEINEKTGQIKLFNITSLDNFIRWLKFIGQFLRRTGGYSKKRNLRKVASIPVDVIMAMGERGFELLRDDKELRKFLKEHPEYMIVEKL